ncbi:hypothetical protein [Dyella japonica]|uniref:Uncharacterized protein n=1 Tax=Dyella japonica A8 TaxID=1217721 RepID=A0A075K662_9GAMM|nr:hypothetical protein [Dyella japonica]AIF47668.1 hypothetical protein HY57_10530 [Dyella japonica A8]
MVYQLTDADIIQEAYAERLKALFDNYTDMALADPEGARARFVTGVAFLRNVRESALQALPPDAAPAGALAMHAVGLG